MASLQITFGKLRFEVQRYLGFGRSTNYNDLQSGQQGDVIACIERGMRQFYNPPPMPNESSSHEWTFLRGEGVIETVAPYTTGTITSSGATVTGSGTTFTDAMVGRILHTNNELREVASRASNTSIGLDRALGSDLGSATTFEILANEYALATDFGGIRGSFTYRDGDGYMPLRLVNESAVRMLRSQESIRKGVPEYCAIIPSTTDNDGTSAQTYKLSLFPFPDKVYDLYYAYTVFVESPTDNAAGNADDNNVPTGGMMHGETILASCLAVAEQMVDEFNNPGKMAAAYQQRLAASISFDRRQMLPDGFGYNSDNSDRQMNVPSRRRLQTVSYRDTLYP